MKWILIVTVFLFMKDEVVIFDGKNNSPKWYITNDTVMGGISNSTIKLDKDGKAIFSGEVSTDNNGGFAMTRLPVDINFEKEKTKIVLKIKGDGKQYQLRLKSKRYQRYSYVQTFQTTKKSEEITLQLSDFYPTFRGYKLNLENFSSETIKEVAILIGNKKDEQFSLEIEKISIK